MVTSTERVVTKKSAGSTRKGRTGGNGTPPHRNGGGSDGNGAGFDSPRADKYKVGMWVALAGILVIVAIYIGLADRYSPLTAALVLMIAFLLIAIVALACCILVQRRNVQRATLALHLICGLPGAANHFTDTSHGLGV